MWTPESVRRLETSEDNIAHAVDHWLDWIIGGFITEFAVDTSINYSEVEQPLSKDREVSMLSL